MYACDKGSKTQKTISSTLFNDSTETDKHEVST